MADMYAVKKETLDNIAQAIRTKRNITDGISVDDMAMQIGLISGGGSGAEIKSASGSWIAESLSYRQFIIDHNLNLEDPLSYIYIIRYYAHDKDHIYPANNLTVGGSGILLPTSVRESEGYNVYNSTKVAKDLGTNNGMLKQWFSGSDAVGSVTYINVLSQTSNNSFYLSSDRLILGLGLRACEVGLQYDWELICIKL